MEKTREELEREYVDSYYTSDRRKGSLQIIGCLAILALIMAFLTGVGLLLFNIIN